MFCEIFFSFFSIIGVCSVFELTVKPLTFAAGFDVNPIPNGNISPTINL